MYTSLHIKGFRCFRDLKIDKLARINLIGGKNNTGKTALLEALHLACGDAREAVPLFCELYVARGLGIDLAASLGPGVWFTDFGDGASADIALRSGDGKGHALRLHNRQGAGRIDLLVDGKPGETVCLSGRTIPFSREPERLLGLCLMLPAREHPRRELMADLFSKLQEDRQEQFLIGVLTHVEPRLTDVTLLAPGGLPLLYADIGGPRRVPLPLVGEGMNRAAFLAMALWNVRRGVLLVDEIENGLHHSVMAKVWAAIASAAKDLDVQVFATTHSYECVEAAVEGIGEGVGEEEFLYHRLDRVEDDIVCRTYAGSTLPTALEMSLEVR